MWNPFKKKKPLRKWQGAFLPVRPQTLPLRAHWRTWLAEALTRSLKVPVSVASATATLETATRLPLTSLDAALRDSQWRDERWGYIETARAPGVGDDFLEDLPAFLFVAGCVADGYLREAALREFRAQPGRLAMWLALLRCNDWVAEVQAAAVDLLTHLLSTGHRANLLDAPELLIALRQRERFRDSAWLPLIEPALLHPDSAAARWEASLRGSGIARVFAFDLIARADAARLPETIARALADPHPALGRWALATAAERLPAHDVDRWLDQALAHRNAMVRVSALRDVVSRRGPEARPSLLQAVFDPAAGMRTTASYWLRERFGLSAVPLWRDALESGHAKKAMVALFALSEVAQPEDTGRFSKWLDHPTPRVRIAALRGLIRTGSPDGLARLREALKDPSPTVVQQAIVLYANTPGSLAPEDLRSAHAAASDPRAIQFLIRAAQLLDKWSSLDILLAWFALDPRDEALVRDGLAAWLARESRDFTPLGEDRRARVSATLALARRQHPDFGWQRLELSLQHS